MQTPRNRSPLDDAVSWPSLEALEQTVRGWSSLRVLVVGDVMLDEDRSGVVDRLSPEAPVPVVRVESTRGVPGGAGNVARNLTALGAQCDLIGVIGADPEGDAFLEVVGSCQVGTEGVAVLPNRPTTHKLRILGRGQQLLRLDREEIGPLDREARARIEAAFVAQLEACDVVVLQDYAKGLFAAGFAEFCVAQARAKGRPVFVDPKTELARFRGADLLKPNEAEALQIASEFGGGEVLDAALVEKLQTAAGGGDLVVTRGAAGMLAVRPGASPCAVRTESLSVFDVQGAGDTSIAALALARTARASLEGACIVANAAASVAVGKIGTAAVTRAELLARLPRSYRAATEHHASHDPGTTRARRENR